MKKTMIVLLALTLVVAFALPQAMAKSEKAKGPPEFAGLVVDICHFPGHGSAEGPSDWVITGQGKKCLNNGGEILTVGVKACEKGHGLDYVKCMEYAYPESPEFE